MPSGRTRASHSNELVQLLEKNTWVFTGNGELGPYSYFLEAAVSDESVQS
jgi:hypothetical protein